MSPPNVVRGLSSASLVLHDKGVLSANLRTSSSRISAQDHIMKDTTSPYETTVWSTSGSSARWHTSRRWRKSTGVMFSPTWSSQIGHRVSHRSRSGISHLYLLLGVNCRRAVHSTTSSPTTGRAATRVCDLTPILNDGPRVMGTTDVARMAELEHRRDARRLTGCGGRTTHPPEATSTAPESSDAGAADGPGGNYHRGSLVVRESQTNRT